MTQTDSQTRFGYSSFILVFAAAIIAGISFLILHDTKTAYAANDASSSVLKVSPVRKDIQITQGTGDVVKVFVTNVTKDKISVKPIENDFIAGDENGTPALILDANKYAPTHSLKRFMVPLTDFTIDPGKTATVSVRINVPRNAQAGGYFGAIRFAPSDPASGGQVNLSASVASLILLTVPGPVTEKLDLTNFDIMQGSKTIGNFSSNGDLRVLVRFENKGNIQEGPFGKIYVKQGNKVVYDHDFNIETPRDMVLPDSARRWEVPLKNIGSFGHYTVGATLTYGKDNRTIEISKSFWVIPWKVIILATAGLVVLVGLIVGIWLGLRNYKRRILRQYGRGRRR